MIPVLEAVPNFSEGRDAGFVRELVACVESIGVEVLDVTSDADHHRTVLTFIGAPRPVEDASIAAARCAVEWIDLRTHDGIHPRVGALDVLPFVPLHDLGMSDAVASAHRVGARLQALGVPVYFYGRASEPPGRRLAELRRGGFERLQAGFPSGREPDLPVRGREGGPHPTAGVTCVGARDVLLAWNVYVEGVALPVLRDVAARIRESGGGFARLRALGLELSRSGRLQISMNLEDLEHTSPLDVFDEIVAQVGVSGGQVVETEVIGMIPDPLVHTESRDRLKLFDASATRVLSMRVAEHVASRASELDGISTNPHG